MNRPILIGIGASHSGAGKTTLASNIFQHFALRPFPADIHRLLRWGAIKYTRTESPAEVISDRSILMEEGKDTCMMLTSGAEDVIWVRAGHSGLRDALLRAVTRLSHLDALIIEGNSAIEFLNPDIVIFIFGKGKEHWKPGIEKLAARADIIFSADDVQLPANIQPRHRFPGGLSEDEAKGFFSALTRMVYERRTETGDAQKGR